MYPKEPRSTVLSGRIHQYLRKTLFASVTEISPFRTIVSATPSSGLVQWPGYGPSQPITTIPAWLSIVQLLPMHGSFHPSARELKTAPELRYSISIGYDRKNVWIVPKGVIRDPFRQVDLEENCPLCPYFLPYPRQSLWLRACFLLLGPNLRGPCVCSSLFIFIKLRIFLSPPAQSSRSETQ